VCSPSRYAHYGTTGTCLKHDEVASIAASISSIVPFAKDILTEGRGKAPLIRLLKRMHKAFGTPGLGYEHMWLSKLKSRLPTSVASRLEHAFRPAHPPEWLSNSNAWLSTDDITHVMTQYNDSHRKHGFKFVGVFPRDFAKKTWIGSCVSQAMCELTVRGMMEEGVSQLGFVFNLDLHHQSGSHWTGMYCGLNPRRPNRFGCWYYDSVGTRPPKEMIAFQKRMQSEVADAMGVTTASRFQVVHNRVRRQFKNTECGIYSMYFIVCMLTTRIPFDKLCTQGVRDDATMHKLREVFFRKPMG
jgi:hypothetical protein